MLNDKCLIYTVTQGLQRPDVKNRRGQGVAIIRRTLKISDRGDYA